MSFLSKMAQGLGLSRKGADMASADLLAMLGGSGYARSGAMVSWKNSLCITAVLGCVRVVSEDIAKVDLELFENDGESINPAVDHPVYDLLTCAPNSWQTSFEFREMITASAMLTGDGLAYITRAADGTPLELLPLPRGWVSIRRPVGTWDLVYTITFPNGGGTVQATSKNILHLRGISMDGVVGADIIRLAREAVGLAMSGEEHQARLAEGSLRTPGYLTTDKVLSAQQVAELKEWLKDNAGGVRNAGNTPLFQNGLEFKELGATGREAEILETRKFQVEEICRAFRVFPQMVGYTDKTSTHGSAQEFFAAHIVHTLQPWAARWEQVIIRDLLTKEDRRNGFRPKFMLQDLLRGDPEARGNFYKDLAQCGAITPNEIRRREGMNPLRGLDVPLRPVNMTPENGDDGDGNDSEDATEATDDPQDQND